MKKLLYAAFAALLACVALTPALAQVPQGYQDTVSNRVVTKAVRADDPLPVGMGAGTTVAINVSTATTTRLVALSGTTKTYVTHLNVISGGTGNITFVYGTGATCGTGTTSLSGAYNLTAQAGLSAGAGVAPVMVVPAGQSLCVTTSAAVQMSGFLTYVQR
jgi:hypothetical protein